MFLRYVFFFSLFFYFSCLSATKSLKENKAMVQKSFLKERNSQETLGIRQRSSLSSNSPTQSKNTAQKLKRQIAQSLLKETVFKNWKNDLIQRQQILSRENFKKALNEVVCPQLERLNKSSYEKTESSEEYFKQLIRFYGSITNYTLDHNYFYCLADFLKDPSHTWIQSFSKKVLTQKERKSLIGRLDVCYQENLEGNGDFIPQSLELKPLTEFSKMSKEEQEAYTQKLRNFYLQIEAL